MLSTDTEKEERKRALEEVEDLEALFEYKAKYAPKFKLKTDDLMEAKTQLAKELNIRFDSVHEKMIKQVHKVAAHYNKANFYLSTIECELGDLRKELIKCNSHCEKNLNILTKKLKSSLDYFRQLSIIIIGDSCAGKSTVCNMMLGDKVLPRNIAPWTNAIITIRYGEKKHAIGYKRDTSKEPHIVDLEAEISVCKRIEKEFEFGQKIWPPTYAKIEIQWPSEFLKEGLVLVDTPGVSNAEDARNKLVANDLKEYLPNCTALIFLFNSSLASVSDEFSKLIKDIALHVKNLQKKGTSLVNTALFISNKWDQVAKSEEAKGESALNDVVKSHWFPNPKSKQLYEDNLFLKLDARRAFKSVTRGAQAPASFVIFGEKLALVLDWAFQARCSAILNDASNLLQDTEKIIRSVLLQCVRTAETNTYIQETAARLSVDVKRMMKPLIANIRDQEKQLFGRIKEDMLGKQFFHISTDLVRKVANRGYWATDSSNFNELALQAIISYLRERELESKEFDSLQKTIMELVKHQFEDISEDLEAVNRSLYGTYISESTLALVLLGVGLGTVGIIAIPIAIGLTLILNGMLIAVGYAFLIIPPIFLSVKAYNKEKYNTNPQQYIENQLREFIRDVFKECDNPSGILGQIFQDDEEDWFTELANMLHCVTTPILAALEKYSSSIDTACEKANSFKVATEQNKQELQQTYYPLYMAANKVGALLAEFELRFVELEGALPRSDLTISTVELGSGGYANVYEGSLMQETRKSVAVKRLKKEKYNDSFFRMFVHEIRILRSLRHPNVVQCHGWVIQNHESPEDKYFDLLMVMEKCSTTLATYIKKKEYPNFVALKFSLDIASGMQYIHSHALIHRDLKPDNILISEEGVAKVADCGIAKPTDACCGTLAGTPVYMAPEVPKHCYSRKADVFSFGLVLWELWHRQFTCEERSPEWKPQFSGNPYLPPKITNLILNCCEYLPKNRPLFTRVCELLKKETESGLKSQ